MLLLDTNHFSELERASEPGWRLRHQIDAAQAVAFISVITAEESMRGWLAQIKLGRDRGVSAYGRFKRGMELIAEWDMLPWDEDTADWFDELKSRRIGVGTLDLRIASIALAYDAMLLTRNFVDFRKIPELKIENWLD